MDNLTLNAEGTLSYCKVCNGSIADIDSFCNHCGYPLKGSETEQQYFLSERNGQQIDLEEYEKAISTAGKTLYWLAGATTVWGFINYFMSVKNRTDDTPGATLIVNLILCSIYLALGLWSKKKPVAALASGFTLYIIVQLLTAFVSPLYLFKGILIKILFIGYFIKGIKSAMEAERLRKQYNL